MSSRCIYRALRNVKVEFKVADTQHESRSYFKVQHAFEIQVKLAFGGTCQTLHKTFLDFNGM